MNETTSIPYLRFASTLWETIQVKANGRIVLAAWFAGTLLACASGWSQESSNDRAPVGASSNSAELDSEAAKLLEKLRELRQRPSLIQNAPNVPMLRASSNSSGGEPGTEPSHHSALAIESLRQRLDLLKSLLETNREPAKPFADATSDTGPNTIPHPDTSTHPDSVAQEILVDGHSPTDHPDSVPNSHGQDIKDGDFPMPNIEASSSDQHSDPNSTVPHATGPKFVGQPIMPAAVDPLELANSLFQTGNFELALKTYQAVGKRTENLHDTLWTEYFIASCHRITGNLAQAETAYRNLAATKRPPYPVEAAQWWLIYLDQRKTSKSAMADIERDLTAISDERNKNAK